MPRFQDRLVVAGRQLLVGARALAASSGRQHIVARNDQGHVLVDVPLALAVALARSRKRFASRACSALVLR